MAKKLEELILKISAETEELRKDLKKSQAETSAAMSNLKKSVDSAAKESEKSFFSFKRAAEVGLGVLGSQAILGAINAAKAALQNLAKTMVSDGVKAAQVQEDAVHRLNTALKISGEFTEEASRELQDYASSLQQATKFGDEAIIETQALIQNLGGLSKDGLKQATQAALDLSSALKIDLKAAALLVGKAAAGNVSSFSRYGLVMQKGKDSAETFANALEAINSKFGGSAAAEIQTYSGVTQQASNTWGDLTEEIGFSITKNEAVIAVITEVNKATQDAIGFLSAHKDEMKAFVAEGLVSVINMVPSLIDGLGLLESGFTGFFQAINTTRGVIAEFTGDTSLSDKLVEERLELESNSRSRQEAIATIREYAVQLGERVTEASDNASRSIASMSDAQMQNAEITTAQRQALAELEAQKQKNIDKSVEFANSLLEQNNLEKTTLDDLALKRKEDAASAQEYHDEKLAQLSDRLSKEEEMIGAAFESGRITEDQALDASLEATKKAAIEEAKIRKELKTTVESIEKTKWGAIKTATGDTLSNIASLQNSKNKEMAFAGKAAAKAQALIATYQGATQAFTSLSAIPIVGPALGAAAAAAAIVAGLANVQRINGTPLRSGMTRVPGIGAQDNFPAVLAPNERVVTSAQNQDLTRFLERENRSERKSQNVTNIHVTIQGNVFDRRDTGLAIIDALNEVGFATGAALA